MTSGSALTGGDAGAGAARVGTVGADVAGAAAGACLLG